MATLLIKSHPAEICHSWHEGHKAQKSFVLLNKAKKAWDLIIEAIVQLVTESSIQFRN
jgi:hypothetical protein